ncbi:MAG: hypothetical protein GDA56_09005 [Hormoscilla sp. GM7CHS1pb]|nr:hypothetical protein [Hormoscilla sp. GM7CHS1pb]
MLWWLPVVVEGHGNDILFAVGSVTIACLWVPVAIEFSGVVWDQFLIPDGPFPDDINRSVEGGNSY